MASTMAMSIAFALLPLLASATPVQIPFLPSHPSDSLQLSAPTPPKPYCLVDTDCFPSDSSLTFKRFNSSLSGALRRVRPIGSVCYSGSSYDAKACEALPKELGDPFFRRAQASTLQYTNWELLVNGSGCPNPPSFPHSSSLFPSFSHSFSPSAPPNESFCEQGAVPPVVIDLSLIEATNKTWWGRAGRSRAENVARAVQEVVKFSKSHHARLRIKNTGHDYLGRSSGPGSLTLLTSSLNHTLFNRTFTPSCPNSPRAPPPPVPAIEAGAGVINADLYKFADTMGVGVTGGASKTVGVSGGAVGGGGHGPLGRTWGMISDNALQFEIVTADGQVRNASVCENADLYWALRGGGAGTFGVVLRVWFRTHPKLRGVAGLFGTVTAKNATAWNDVVRTLMDAMPDLDRRGIAGYAETMYPTLYLAYVHPFTNSTPSDRPLKEGFAPFEKLVKEAGGAVNASLTTAVEESWYGFWSGPLQKAFGPLDATGINILIGSRLVPRDVVKDSNRRAKVTEMLANLESPAIIHLVAGGEVSKVEPRLSALNPAWRTALLHIDMPATWPALASSPSSGASAYAASLNKTVSYVHGITTKLDAAIGTPSAAYMNEADVDEGKWQDTFWGAEHYTVLKRLKGKWDAEGVFSCRKCVGSEDFGF